MTNGAIIYESVANVATQVFPSRNGAIIGESVANGAIIGESVAYGAIVRVWQMELQKELPFGNEGIILMSIRGKWCHYKRVYGKWCSYKCLHRGMVP